MPRYFRTNETEARILADIRELLYLLVLQKSDSRPGSFMEARFNEFRDERMSIGESPDA